METKHLSQTFLLLLGLALALAKPFENSQIDERLKLKAVNSEDFDQIRSSNEGKLDQTRNAKDEERLEFKPINAENFDQIGGSNEGKLDQNRDANVEERLKFKPINAENFDKIGST